MATATATVLFSDIEGSTALRARIGEAAADRLFLESERLMARVVERRHGRVVKTAGDGVMAAFDSASDAIGAAVEMQQALARQPGGPRIRVGIAAGDVSWEGNDCHGLPVVTAARLEANAEGGQILVSQVVRWLAGERSGARFEPVGSLDLKGLPDPVEAFAVAWESTPGTDAEGVSLPAALRTPADFAFVGREAEWDQLSDAWRSVRDGARRVVLIGGEAGAGKTRLASEFVRQCHEEGGAVLFGGCDEQLVVPFQPWVQVLDHLVRSLPLDELSDDGDGDLGVLAPLLPRLHRSTVPRPLSGLDADTERYRLFTAFEAVLAEASRRWPVVVVLDDLHWAGAQTLALLAHIARNGSGRTLLIGTFRDTGDELTDPLATALADLRRVAGVTRLRVGGLDESGVASLMAEATGQELDRDLSQVAAMVATRSRGNAFFVGELWRHLVESGAVSRVDDRWVVHGSLEAAGVPDSVREVVADRLARLDFPARRLMELAAVAGPRVELAVLSIAADLPAGELADALDGLVTADLLEVIERPRLVYQFAHALVRDTVAEGVPPAARALLHLRIADAIETLHESDRRGVLPDLAQHYAAAAVVGGSGKAVYYARQAAAKAMQAVAYHEAEVYLRRVLELTDPSSTGRVEVLVGIGDALLHQSRWEEAIAAYDAAFSQARDLGEVRLAAEAALGFEDSVHTPGLPGGPAVALVSKAIALVGDDGSSLRARLEAALSRALTHAGRAEEAEAALQSALALAASAGDQAMEAALQAALIGCNDPHRLLEYAAHLETVAERLGDSWSVAYTTINQLRAYTMLGQLDRTKEVLARHWTLGKSSRLLLVEMQSLGFEVVLALAMGRFDDAEASAERAFDLAVQGGDSKFAAGVNGLQMFVIRREQGRLSEVAPVLEAVSRRPDGGGVWRPGLAVLYAELGMLDEARQQFELLACDEFASVPRDAVWPGSVSFLADVCIALGDRAQAPVLYREMLPFEGQNLMVAMTVCVGPADRLLGGLAALDDRPGDARRHYETALALTERSGSPVWRAQVQHDLARLLSAEGDRSGAARLAAEALETARELGMATLAERCHDLTRSPGLRLVADDSAPVLPDGLSVREVEVLRLVAAGCSNREIGTRLLISSNTAANHVRAILQKTTCANRAEAVAYAARHRLLAD